MAKLCARAVLGTLIVVCAGCPPQSGTDTTDGADTAATTVQPLTEKELNAISQTADAVRFLGRAGYLASVSTFGAGVDGCGCAEVAHGENDGTVLTTLDSCDVLGADCSATLEAELNDANRSLTIFSLDLDCGNGGTDGSAVLSFEAFENTVDTSGVWSVEVDGSEVRFAGALTLDCNQGRLRFANMNGSVERSNERVEVEIDDVELSTDQQALLGGTIRIRVDGGRWIALEFGSETSASEAQLTTGGESLGSVDF